MRCCRQALSCRTGALQPAAGDLVREAIILQRSLIEAQLFRRTCPINIATQWKRLVAGRNFPSGFCGKISASARNASFDNKIALKYWWNTVENRKMPNNSDTALKWLLLLKDQALPHLSAFAEQLATGAVTSLCKCGCHGFDFHVPEGVPVAPLQSGSGLFCELVFESNLSEEIDILLFTDVRGYLCRVDVTYGAGNHDAMPDNIVATGLKNIRPAERR